MSSGLFVHPKTGNVGIGTVAPRTALEVAGTITASNVRVIGDFVTLNTVTSNTEQVVVTNAGTGPALKVTQTGAEAIAEFYDGDGGVLALKVADGGNVGIGTATPMAKLHVAGSTTLSGTLALEGALVNNNSSGKVRKYSTFFSSTQNVPTLVGSFFFGGSSQHLTIKGTILVQSGGSFGITEIDCHFRSNTNTTNDIAFSLRENRKNHGISVRCIVYHNTTTGEIRLGFTTDNSTYQSAGWDLNIYERGDYNFFNNRNSFESMGDLSGFTERVLSESFQRVGGDLTVNGNVGIGTSNAQAKLHIEGDVLVNGVKFPSTPVLSADPNTFDDYKEGTWTPQIGGRGGGVKAIGSGNNGWYTKIGRQVFCGGTLSWNSTDTLTGEIIITNLPYTSANISNMRSGGSIGAISNGIAVTSGFTYFTLVIDPNRNYVFIIQNNPNGSYSHFPTVSNSGIVYGFNFNYAA